MRFLYRKLYRLVGLIFPIMYYFNSRQFITIFIFIILILSSFIDIFRLIYPNFNKWFFKYFHLILKEKEKGTISGTTYFLMGFLIVAFFFEKPIAITAFVFSIFGDIFSAMVGKKFGKVKIKEKSLEGAFGCFAICIFFGIILIYLNLEINFKTVILGALGATLIEVLPLKIDDNLTLPIFSALVMRLF